MNCSRWRRLAALAAGEDLNPAQEAGLTAHLEACASCRKLHRELRRDLDHLRALDAAGIGTGEPASVRGAVMTRIEKRRPAFGMPVPSHLAAAVAVVLLVGTLGVLRWRGGDSGGTRRPEIAETTSAAEVVPSALAPPDPVPETAPGTSVPEVTTAGRITREPRSPRSKSPDPLTPQRVAAAEPMTMKILTDDPEVVIYWIVEAKGEIDA
jgi:hypothetical protein